MSGEGQDQNAGNQDGAGQGDDNLGWRADLPEDIRTNETLAKFTDVNGLAQGYINAEQLIGRDKIPMPKTDDEWESTYTRLGRPETDAEYAMPISDNFEPAVQEALKLDIDVMRPMFHKLGLNNKQATNLFTEYSNLVDQKIKEVKEGAITAKTNAEVELKAEFGQGYEGKMVLANRAAEAIGGKELLDLFDSTEIGSHPTMVKAFIKIGERMSEELGLDKDTGAQTQSKESMQADIDELMTSEAYLTADHPGHAAAVLKVNKLMGYIHGTAPVSISLT